VLARAYSVLGGVVEKILIAEVDLSGARVERLEESLSRPVTTLRGKQLLVDNYR